MKNSADGLEECMSFLKQATGRPQNSLFCGAILRERSSARERKSVRSSDEQDDKLTIEMFEADVRVRAD